MEKICEYLIRDEEIGLICKIDGTSCLLASQTTCNKDIINISILRDNVKNDKKENI